MKNARNPADRLKVMTEQELAVLQRRHSLIKNLANVYRPSQAQTAAVAQELGLHDRQVRRLVARFRSEDDQSLSLVPKTAGRRPGKRLLSPIMEQIIADVLTRCYINKQRPSFNHSYRQIKNICRERKLAKPPSQKAVRARLLDFDPVMVARRRHGQKAAQTLKPITGQGPEANQPMHVVQIDHTPMDVILVDTAHRQPVGRAYVTFAIDLYSRCIAGFHISHEAPSSVTVALCMLSIAADKDVILQKHGIAGTWPLCGVPEVIHTDNGSEFHGRALTQGALINAIELRYRPPGKPWYGGTIESRIKRFMSLAHNELPGTTRSNSQDRGEYPSEKMAALTLAEIEQWLILAIIEYHATVQDGISEPPLNRLNFGLASHTPRQVEDLRLYAIDFLPVVNRKLRRDGFHLDHFTYYDPQLDYYIARRDRFPSGFEIRQDPRNMAYVWVKKPDGDGYIELSHRNITRGNIMKWEHKAALKQLRDKNILSVDQDLIIETANARRELARKASLKTKSARRSVDRVATRSAPLSSPSLVRTPHSESENGQEITPFEGLEVNL